MKVPTRIAAGAGLAVAAALLFQHDPEMGRSESPLPRQKSAVETRRAEMSSAPRQVAEARVAIESVAADYRQLSGVDPGAGDPEFGHFGNLQALEQHVAHLARFGKTEEQFVDDCLRWGRPGQLPKVTEEEYLNPGNKAMTEDQRTQLQQEVDLFNVLLADAARSAYSFLEFETERYARGELKRIPRGTTHEPVTDDSLFRAYARVEAGDWFYIVDFRSAGRPDLHGAIAAVHDLRVERLQSIRHLIAGF